MGDLGYGCCLKHLLGAQPTVSHTLGAGASGVLSLSPCLVVCVEWPIRDLRCRLLDPGLVDDQMRTIFPCGFFALAIDDKALVGIDPHYVCSCVVVADQESRDRARNALHTRYIALAVVLENRMVDTGLYPEIGGVLV